MKKLISLVFGAICLISLSCGGGGAVWPGTPDYPAGPIDQGLVNQGKDQGGDPRVALPALTGVNCVLKLPVGCPLDPSTLRIQGFMDSDNLGNPTDNLRTIVRTIRFSGWPT
jgi:hypothetical protein